MNPLRKPVPSTSLARALDRALDRDGVIALDPGVPPRVWRRALVGPAHEFLSRKGKELRGRLVRAGWELGGGDASAMPPALETVVELLHAGSLIVDDVEDDGELRRDRPALHRLIGAPLAINTGSWMYFWALGELAASDLPPLVALEAHRAAVATMIRCHQGQALDLSTRVIDLDAAEVPPVVAATTRLKTGALCRFAAELGALAAGAPASHRAAIAELGDAMGLALQMLDDLGSVASADRRDKGREDLRGARPTWPWAWLAERVDRFEWARLVGSLRAVADGGADPDPLADALAAVVADTGRRHARAAIERAITALVAALGEGRTVAEVIALLRSMEAYYA